MKILKQIPTYLLAFVYIFFGALFFLKLMPAQPVMSANAITYSTLLYTTGFLTLVKVFEIAFGILLIIPKTKALGLLLIAPISVNILLFEIFLAKQPGIGILMVLLNAIAIYQNKEKYNSILA